MRVVVSHDRGGDGRQAVAALNIEGAKIGAAEFLSIRLLLVGHVCL